MHPPLKLFVITFKTPLAPVPVFSREEKDLIRDTTINAIHLRLQQRRRLP